MNDSRVFRRFAAVFAVSAASLFFNPAPARPTPPSPPAPKLKSGSAAATAKPQKKTAPVELPILAEAEPASEIPALVPSPGPAAPLAPPPTPALAQPAAPDMSVEEYQKRAALAIAKGDWASAENYLRSAIRIDPDNADVVMDLSKVLAEQGKSEAALAVLVGYGGDDARVVQALAEGYVSQDRYVDAERLFMSLSFRQPSVASHRYNLGLVESAMGKYELAENAYLRAVELDPSFADARYNLALLYIRMRDFPKALAQLEEAVRLRTDADYLINYAVVLRELNRVPSALAALEQALTMDRTNTLALNNLGMTHYVAGNRKEAQKAFLQVVSQNPEDPTARSYLAKLQAEIAMPAPPEIAEPAPAQSTATPPRAPEMPAVAAAVQGDMLRLQRENDELKDKLVDVEARMEKLVQTMPAAPAAKKEKDKDKKSGAAAKRNSQQNAPSRETRDEVATAPPAEEIRIEELRQNIADVRAELETIRRDRGYQAAPPEPGSTEVRLDAADRAVMHLQRQIRQLVIERDLLRAEIRAIRDGGLGGGVGGLIREAGQTNINLADLNALLLIPGVDERLAHNILWYRQNIGPFRSLVDLKNVPGMDETRYAQLLDFVSVGPGESQ